MRRPGAWLLPALIVLLTSACGSSSAASTLHPTQPTGVRAATPAAQRTATSTTTRTTPAAAAPSCPPAGAHVLAASRRARVYALGGSVYGCAAPAGRSYRLGAASRSPGQARVGPVAVAGTVAAYALTSFGIDIGASVIAVRDLASGRLLHQSVAIHRALPQAYQLVSAIVVKPDGAVAWISQIESVIRRAAGGLAVLRLDAHGAALLDASSRIRPRSLRLHGSTLTWRDGAQLRSATLS